MASKTPSTVSARRRSRATQASPERHVDAPWRTIDETAHYLGVSRSTVYGLMRDGLIRWTVVGHRRRIHEDEIARYLRRVS